MSLHVPSAWWLLALSILPLLWWRWSSGRGRAVLPFSGLWAARGAGGGFVGGLRRLIPILRTLALALLVVALARPRLADERTRVRTEGVAIELVVDRSGSMRAQDFSVGGRPADRLAAVKRVVHAFVAGGDDLPGRPDDLIGLIVFARHPDSRCPLTLDHAHLLETVGRTRFVVDREEDGTALGDAMALAVERLAGLEQRADLRGKRSIRGRVMIVLTDGENNVGDIDPLTAARMAEAYGIRIYTIGAGTDAAFAPVPVTDAFGRERLQNVPVSLDEQTLRAVAEQTGGQYFRATDTDSLSEVYARIDALERTEIEQQQFVRHAELAVDAVSRRGLDLPPLLAVVVVLLVLETIMRSTRWQVIP